MVLRLLDDLPTAEGKSGIFLKAFLRSSCLAELGLANENDFVHRVLLNLTDDETVLAMN